MDSQLGESGYSLGGIGGRGTLQRIPEEPPSSEGWPQPTSWPKVKEQSKKVKADEEVLIRPGELSSSRSEEFTKRPENLAQTTKSAQTKASEVEQEEEELGISHLILHTKETFIA